MIKWQVNVREKEGWTPLTWGTGETEKEVDTNYRQAVAMHLERGLLQPGDEVTIQFDGQYKTGGIASDFASRASTRRGGF